MMQRMMLVVWCVGFGAAISLAAQTPQSVVVSAGQYDRSDTLVLFPADVTGSGQYLRASAEGGETLPVDAAGEGLAGFIVGAMKAGETKTFHLQHIQTFAPIAPKVTAKEEGGAVHVSVDGKSAFVYRAEKTPLPTGFEPEYARGGYIHPLVTPGGVEVTDDYPPNHKHHHGLWAPWTKTEFEGRHPDFWNMGQKTGTVEFVKLGTTHSGQSIAAFSAQHRFVDLSAKPEPKVALNETWQLRAYKTGGETPRYRLVDLESTQTCASDSPLKLPQYHYGGLGLRGNRQWDGANGCNMLTSEGKTRENGNETRANWMALAGKVDGKLVYVAVLCSPENFRHPQPVRLHPSEPFVCFAPQQLGEFSIEPAKPYKMKYRLVFGDGELNAKEIDRLWTDYANPVQAKVN